MTERRRTGVKWKGWSALLALLLLLGTVASAVGTTTIYGYTEGLALASNGVKWGYADTAGKLVIPLRFDSAQSFHLGIAKVEERKHLGVIRADGSYLIHPEYDSLTSVGYGVYLAQRGDFWGVLSLIPFPSQMGGETQELYPFVYDDIVSEQNSGLNVLTFWKDGVRTVVPLSSLPELLVARKVPSAQFPLIQGRLPTFRDAGPRDWFTLWVDVAFNVGLMDGKGDGSFDPHSTLTVAEALKLAAQMESRFTGDDFHRQPITSQPWYGPSVVYCVASGIIQNEEFPDVTRPVTRAETARIFAATSLGRSLPERNDLGRVRRSLPDVGLEDYAAGAIYALYSKGVFTGSDGALSFRPGDRLTRAEAAAIVARMARSEQRVSLWPDRARSTPLLGV